MELYGEHIRWRVRLGKRLASSCVYIIASNVLDSGGIQIV